MSTSHFNDGCSCEKAIFNKHLCHVGNKFSTFFINDILYHTIFTALEEPDVQWALNNDRFLVKKTFDFDIGKLWDAPEDYPIKSTLSLKYLLRGKLRSSLPTPVDDKREKKMKKWKKK